MGEELGVLPSYTESKYLPPPLRDPGMNENLYRFKKATGSVKELKPKIEIVVEPIKCPTVNEMFNKFLKQVNNGNNG